MTALTHIRSAFALVLSRGVVLVAGLLTGILTARALGPEGRGQYFAITTTATILAQFGNLGLSSSNVFLGAREPRFLWPLLVNSAWVAIGISLVSAVLALVFGEALSTKVHTPSHLWWAVSAIAPAALFFTLCCSLLTAEERFSAVSTWQLVNAILNLLLLGAAAAIGGSSGTFICATAVAGVLTGVAVSVSVAKGRRGALTFDGAVFGAGWSFASRAYLALVLGYLMQRASVALLIAYSSPREIGLYSIASQIFDVLLIVPSSIAMVIFPKLVKDAGDTWKAIRAPLWQTMALMAVISLVAIVGAKPAITLVFGPAFAASYSVVLCILPAALFTSAVSVLSQSLVATGFPWALILWWALGLAVMCAASVLLIRQMGAAGAAIAQSIGAGVVCMGVTALVRNRISAAKLQVYE